MAYVDGFVVPVPKKNVKAYRTMSKKAGKVWNEHGALDYKECVADDVKIGKMDVVSAQREAEEERDGRVLVHRLQVARRIATACIAKVMKDPRLAKMMDPKTMPFDGKRMIYGGFKVIVDL